MTTAKQIYSGRGLRNSTHLSKNYNYTNNTAAESASYGEEYQRRAGNSYSDHMCNDVNTKMMQNTSPKDENQNETRTATE